MKPRHLARYRDMARLFFKYGRSDLVQQAGLEEALLAEDREETEDGADAAELAEDLEALGPTYIKLGQLLSTRSDLLPPAYIEALSRLQDRIEPFPFPDVERIVTDALGVRLTRAFEAFEEEPIAAASLGQVHRAVLRSGEVAAVKVQRPHIRERISEDLEAFADLAEFLDDHTEVGRRFGFRAVLEDFRKSLFRELDYTLEAGNLTTLATNLAEFEKIMVPMPVPDYTTSRVLTMEFVTGEKITSLSPLRLMELDGDALADTVFEAYLKQILVDGVFHADPHPGNVFLTDDDRVALIDLGMVGRVSPGVQERLLRLLLAVADGQGERVADIALELGRTLDGFDRGEYYHSVSQLVAEHQEATLQQIDVGRVVMEITHKAGERRVRLPPELALLGKTLLNLDMVGRTLSPDFNPREAIQRHVTEIMRRRTLNSLSPSNIFNAMLEMRELVQHMPARLNAALEHFAEGRFELRVDAIDEDVLIDGIQKVANRITMGLVLAALIVGAALLMQVPTDFTLLGYPGLAILLFLVAAAGGLLLVVEVWLHDRRVRRRVKDRRK